MLVALLLLLTAVLYPPFLYPAAIALSVTGGWLGIDLWRVARIYRHTLASIA